MKKKLTILCALLMMVTSFASVFADEESGQEIEETDYIVETAKSVDVKLYAEITSSYSVKIPKEFDVKETETNLTIYAKGDITANERLSITYQKEGVALSESVTNEGDEHADVPLTLSGDAANFKWNQIDKEYEQNSFLTINIKHSKLAAGYWSTNLPITIALNTVSE